MKRKEKIKQEEPTEAQPINLEPAVATSEAAEQQPKVDYTLGGVSVSQFEAKASPVQYSTEQPEIPVVKPGRQAYWMIHPTFEFECHLLMVQEDREFYVIQPNILPWVSTKTQCYRLYLGIFPSGTLFLLPTVMQPEIGPWNGYHKAMFNAVPRAKKTWIRLEPDTNSQTYLATEAHNLALPKWPEIDRLEIIHRAFKDRWIITKDHPILKRLRGDFSSGIEQF
jgi:hypothetical protein